VLTARDTIFVIGQDECSTPPPVIYCNQQEGGKFFTNLGLKRVTDKIFETKELWVDANIALEPSIGYRAGREARSRK